MRPSNPSFGATSKSSKQWLARQFRDPYVRQRMGDPAQYRSRSAFKLLEMNAKYKFLEPRRRSTVHPRLIVDLGAAPGGWSQVVALKNGYAEPIKGRDPRLPHDTPVAEQHYGLKPTARMERMGMWSDAAVEGAISLPSPGSEVVPAKIIALDLLRMRPIHGVTAVQTDFLSPDAFQLVRAHFPRNSPRAGVDLLLSDMAANASGNSVVDAESSLRICHAVWRFAGEHLAVKTEREHGGVLVLKHFVHPDTHLFRRRFLMHTFQRVIFVKPPSSRSESAEGYWVCLDWLGLPPPLPIEHMSILPHNTHISGQ